MRPHQLGAWLTLLALPGSRQEEGGGCPHPAIPAAATYTNLTGGLGQETWTVKYTCDNGESGTQSNQWMYFTLH